HAIGRRNEPDVGLARVQVERLDHARRHLAVVDLTHREVAEPGGAAVGQTRQLGHGAAVIGVARQLDQAHALDGGRTAVRLEVERALGLRREFHARYASSTSRRRYSPYALL